MVWNIGLPIIASRADWFCPDEIVPSTSSSSSASVGGTCGRESVPIDAPAGVF